MNSILVTGITGYFGNLLISWLRNYQGRINYLVRGGPNRFLKIHNSYRQEDSVLDFDLISGSAEEIITHLNGLDVWPDKIIHLAANVKFGEEERASVMQTNFGGTQKMIQVARHFGAELIFFSTYYVHGAWPDGKVFPEEFVYCEPKNPYEESKQKSELAIRDSGLDYKIIRPGILADCRDSGYCGLLRYYWLIRRYYFRHPSICKDEVSLSGNFLNLPLQGDYYLQTTPLNFIVGEWVREVLPDIIMAKPLKTIIHLINDDPPVCKECFTDAFQSLGIKPVNGAQLQYSHNLMLKQMVLRIFSYYLSSHPLPDCTNLKKVLGQKYRPHPSGIAMKAALAKILNSARDNNFGLSAKEISRLERILNV